MQNPISITLSARIALRQLQSSCCALSQSPMGKHALDMYCCCMATNGIQIVNHAQCRRTLTNPSSTAKLMPKQSKVSTT